MCEMTSHRDGRGDDNDDDNDDKGAPLNKVRWEYSDNYCDATGFALSKFKSLWTKRHRRGGTRGGGGGPPRFRFADIGGGVVVGATTAINLNGIHEALEMSGAAHRQRESFPLEPAPELEAKRPPPQPKTTVMGGGGGEMIKAASGVNPFDNNDVIHRGGSSLAGGAATTTTTNNDAASAAESFLLTHDPNRPDNNAFDYGAKEDELLPSDEDAAMPSYSRRWPVDDSHYCRRNHHGSQRTHNYAAPQSEFDDLEDKIETLDDEELAALDVDNIVVCQRPIDDDAPYHYAFGNRQGAGNHGGRVPLRTINQQNHNQFGVLGYGAPPSDRAAVVSSSSSHAHHGKGQQLRNWYPPDQRSGGNGALSFGGDSYPGDGYSGDRRKRFRLADVGGVGARLRELLPSEPATKEEAEHTKEEESIEMDYSNSDRKVPATKKRPSRSAKKWVVYSDKSNLELESNEDSDE